VKRKRLLFSGGTDGCVFAWNIDKICTNQNTFDDEGDNAKKEQDQNYYLNFICENTPWFLMGFSSCLVDLPNIELFATGSFKNRIELWVLRTRNDAPQLEDSSSSKKHKHSKTKEQSLKKSSDPSKDKKKEKNHFLDIINNKEMEMDDDVSKLKKKTLEGHKKAIREIAYSEAYKVLISVGFDFQIFLWCPYIEKEIMKIEAHEVPLVGVNCPPGLDCFITCDTKGVVNVWNIQDYSLMQNFSVAGFNNVTSMRVVQKHRRLIIGSRNFKVFEYHKPFIPDVSDDNPILCALFSNIRFEFYIAGGKQINVWNAKNGKPTRCFKNCFESDITSMALDKDHRKLIVGSHLGQIKVFDILSGVMINELDPHSDENGEISFIGYGGDDLSIITTAWDKKIKIHKDDRDEQK
jgi:WD40 repeat protein